MKIRNVVTPTQLSQHSFIAYSLSIIANNKFVHLQVHQLRYLTLETINKTKINCESFTNNYNVFAYFSLRTKELEINK